MEQRTVGRSGLSVSRLGLGTMTWGRDTDADDAAAQLDAFLEAGGTLVDTGRRLRRRRGRVACSAALLPDVVPRDELVIATKAG